MKNYVKIIGVLMAMLLCLLAVGCAHQIDADRLLSNEDIQKVTDELPDELYVGQKIEGLGSYGGASLSWTVVDVDREGVATLLCDSVIDAVPFNNERDINHVRDNETEDLYDELYILDWSNSSIREWLNGDFFASAFDSLEQARIYSGTLRTLNNPLTDRGACVTTDKVFLLSADEARDLFENDEARLAFATDSAKDAGVRVGAVSGASSYWLRTTGESMWCAACVNTDGTVNYSGMTVVNEKIGVRPCVRLISTVPGGEPVFTLEDAVLGNLVEFGTYEQDNDPATTDEAIVWRVIHREGTKRLLISEKVLDACAFDKDISGDKWATSDLRAFLNGDFISAAFSAEEQAMLATTVNVTEDNAKYVVDSGADSTDKVFVLSKAEAEKYLIARNHGWEKAEATIYSQNRDSIGTIYDHGVTVDPDYGTAGWWLRNAGENDVYAMYMFYYGAVSERGTIARNTYVGVRPSVWVDVAE